MSKNQLLLELMTRLTIQAMDLFTRASPRFKMAPPKPSSSEFRLKAAPPALSAMADFKTV